MDRSAPRLLAFGIGCLLLVLAGCTAPTAAPADEPADGQTATTITVENGSFTVDVDRLYDQLQALTGTDVPPPETVHADVPGDEPLELDGSGGLPAFADTVGFETDEVELGGDIGLGYVTGVGTVVAAPPDNATRDDERLLLAHELTHYIQLRNDRFAQLGGQVDQRTTDGSFVLRAIIEGGAVYTTDAYLDQHGESDRHNSPVYDEALAALPPGHAARYGLLQYQAGTAYVSDRVERPADLPAVYEDPPTTSQQVLHGLDPDAAPPAPLDVTLETADDWRSVGTDRMGEAFLRVALESHIDPDRAADVAAEWGEDELHIVEGGPSGEANYAWVHRWDDADAAEEFVDAMGAYLAARGTVTDSAAPEHRFHFPHGTAAKIGTVSPETTVVLFGSDAFLDAAEVMGSDDEVTVTLAPAN